MKVLIVYAHAGPKSFNGALFQVAQQTLRKGGGSCLCTLV